MCGIAGIMNFDGAPVDRKVLVSMTDAMIHRGPDSGGHWVDGAVGLGHRRLSIIDLSAEANQPMVSADGKAVIVFNGEIYNYRELAKELEAEGMRCQTHSDTEVILNLYRRYGTDCLSRLRGMFAFAIWDASTKRLFVARDRVGIKPFCYLLSPKAFVFGSEVKAIAVSGYSGLKMNKNAVAGFMRFLVVPQPDSIFEDIRKLEPGHYLVITPDGSVRDSVYWSRPEAMAGPDIAGGNTYVSALDELLNASVRYHMVADVPVGAFLSGGLDSSTVVSLMREQAPAQKIDAFSIIFPGQGEYDEDKYAREVARLKGITYHADTINESFLNDLGQIAWHLDEPFAISSAYATFYLAKSAAKKTKVVLTGDGGDELFAGYEGYTNNAYLRHRLVSRFLGMAYRVTYALAKYTGIRNGAVSRILAGLRRRSGSEGLRYSEQVAQSSLLTASVVLNADAFLDSLKAWENNLLAHYYDQGPAEDRLQKKLLAEFKTRLVDEMLMKVDRMTMAHSLEARVPLLDHHVVEFAFQLPSDMKLRLTDRGAIGKYIMKKNLEKYLPGEIIYRRKQGFDIPVAGWLKNAFLAQVREKVLDGDLCKAGLIEKAGVEKLIQWHKESRHDCAGMLMLLLAFESWVETYRSRVGHIAVI